MCVAMLVFATQDALSRHLAAQSNAVTVNWIRFAFFAFVVLTVASRRERGIRGLLRTPTPGLHVARGVALVLQLCIFVFAFTVLGLAEAHAVFAVYPLIVVALSAVLLKERVSFWRWLAVAIGFCGVVVLLRPGMDVLRIEAVAVLCGAGMFALYSIWTRQAAKDDSPATSLAYVGLTGFAALTLVTPFFWKPLSGLDWVWMALLCVLGVIAHGLLIKVYDLVEANVVQPLAYLQLVFATAYGVILFDERPDIWTWAGAAILVATGLWSAMLGARRR
jgi:drug/metabolite transporter (DMT)-like permease